MNELPLLIELQGVHDGLRVIHRDLSDFPPELAALDTELKTLAKKLEEAGKALASAQGQQTTLTANLASAQKLEDQSKAALKETRHKVQFTAAIRELDERQRQKAAVARPLKEAETRAGALEKAIEEMEARRAQAQAQFDELHSIFLSEHENQVEAERRLLARKEELRQALPATTVTRFDRLIQHRQGRAVVTIEKGNCGGCNTRLRTPLIAQLREEKHIICESCQRIIHEPQRP